MHAGLESLVILGEGNRFQHISLSHFIQMLGISGTIPNSATGVEALLFVGRTAPGVPSSLIDPMLSNAADLMQANASWSAGIAQGTPGTSSISGTLPSEWGHNPK